jgi:hypothetical protein
VVLDKSALSREGEGRAEEHQHAPDLGKLPALLVVATLVDLVPEAWHNIAIHPESHKVG